MRDLLGLGDGVGYTTGQSTIAEKTRPTRRALYQGIFTGGYSILGLGLGAFIITHLTTAFGWRWAFPLVGLFGFVVTTGLWIALPKSSGDATPAADRLKPTSFFLDLKEIVRIRGVVPVIIAGTLGLAWLGLYIAFASLFLTNVRGYSLDDAGTILSVSTIIGFLGPLLVPAASDMLGRKPTAIVVAIGAGVCYLAFPLVPMATPVLIAVLAVGSICSGGLAPLTLATFFSELVPHRRGAAIGIANFFSAILGATLAPIVGGVLADHMGLVAPVVLAGVCQLVIAPVLLRVPETAPRLVSRRTAPDAVHGAVV
jgi:MFS family permease